MRFCTFSIFIENKIKFKQLKQKREYVSLFEFFKYN